MARGCSRALQALLLAAFLDLCARGISGVVSYAFVGVSSKANRPPSAVVARGAQMIQESDLLQPDEAPSRDAYLIGFVPCAENFNGRVAMIGFFLLLAVEFF